MTSLERYEDPETYAVIMSGEIGGSAEEEAAEWIKANMAKPVVGFIGGQAGFSDWENLRDYVAKIKTVDPQIEGRIIDAAKK